MVYDLEVDIIDNDYSNLFLLKNSFAKYDTKTVGCKRCLYTMNLCSNSHAPNIKEQMTTPVGPMFDPPAELA